MVSWEEEEWRAFLSTLAAIPASAFSFIAPGSFTSSLAWASANLALLQISEITECHMNTGDPDPQALTKWVLLPLAPSTLGCSRACPGASWSLGALLPFL